jgi:hypothetical protein
MRLMTNGLFIMSNFYNLISERWKLMSCPTVMLVFSLAYSDKSFTVFFHWLARNMSDS